MRILVVEDEPRMVELLRKGLHEHGHTVMTCMDGCAAAALAIEYPFDLIVLDVGLPGMNGYQVAQTLRQRNAQVLILMLTAFDQEDDVVRGLNLGADDYLTKPFSFSELLARIRSLTRLAADCTSTSLRVGDLIVDRTQHTVYRDGKQIHLTRTEFRLLQRLLQHSPQIVSRETLTENIWQTERPADRRAFDTLLSGLRNKVDTPFKRALIQTVRRAGYYVGYKSLKK